MPVYKIDIVRDRHWSRYFSIEVDGSYDKAKKLLNEAPLYSTFWGAKWFGVRKIRHKLLNPPPIEPTVRYTETVEMWRADEL